MAKCTLRHPSRAVAAALWLAGLPVIAVTWAADPSPAYSWHFDAASATGGDFPAVGGGTPARAERSPQFREEWLYLDGSNSLSVQDLTGETLPRQELTVTAWAAVEAPLRWGCVAGYIQDNGDYEKGWCLGYQNDRFTFQVSTGPKLVTVYSRTRLGRAAWHHLAGVYDGRMMRLFVDGREEAATDAAAGVIDYPPRAVFSLGAYHDDNEFFRMTGALASVSVYGSALSAPQVAGLAAAAPHGVSVPMRFSGFPYLQFLNDRTARLSWSTREAGAASVRYGPAGGPLQTATAEGIGCDHEVILEQLAPQTGYSYRLYLDAADGRRLVSDAFELDTSFHFCPASVPEAASAGIPEAFREAAAAVLGDFRQSRGLCLVYGSGSGDLAAALACASELTIVGLTEDETAAESARQMLYRTGLYGSRVSIRTVPSLARTPLTSGIANLVVSETALISGRCPGTASEVMRLLRPAGGWACMLLPFPQADSAQDALAQWGRADSAWGVTRVGSRPQQALSYRRPELPGAGVWTHQYGTPANCAAGGESLGGARSTDDLQVQWLGVPGADFGLDRNPRMPAPLSAGGRLFHQGMNRIVALDAYNGTVLWGMEIPHLRRVNMPRDASNWCVDAETVYVAVGDCLWLLDAATGRKRGQLRVPSREDGVVLWGYVAQEGPTIYGSEEASDGPYTRYWGNAAWYDRRDAASTAKVCSQAIFAVDKARRQRRWRYQRGLIVNPTITIADGRVWFVESRNPELLSTGSSRVSSPLLWQQQYLVCLDAHSGELRWEQPIDTEDGTVVFFMAYSPEALIVAASNDAYHLYAFDPKNGALRWEQKHGWTADNHSGHMQHPVLLNGRVYLEPCGYDLVTGERVASGMGKRSGCHTYVGVQQALLYRGDGRQVAMWDCDSARVSVWPRLRPSCWLSLVPAGGLLLVPEAGGGCSCGGWLETSLAFAPRALFALPDDTGREGGR